MNKETIKKVLELFKNYSAWMYYNPKALESLKKNPFELEGYTCYLGLTPEGLVEITIENFPDIKCIYDCRIITAPLQKDLGIENIKYEFTIITPKEKIPEDF